MSNEVIDRLRSAGYKVRTRKQWGTQHADVYAYRLRTKPVDFPVSFMFAHITVTSANGDKGARLVEQIGMERFGSGCSYNWMVDHQTHAIYEGQPLAAKGTHTINDKNVSGFPYNLNYAGHAVAFMAMPGDRFCHKCVELFAAIQAAERLEDIARDSVKFYPHSMFAWKDCPTDAVRNRLDDINNLADQMVKERLAGRKAPTDDPAKPNVSLKALKRAAEHADWSRRLPATRDDVALVVEALRAEGCKDYQDWQLKLGYEGEDADGVPGRASLRKLARKHGFEVVA